MFKSQFFRRLSAYRSQERTYTVNVDLIIFGQVASVDVKVKARCKEQAAKLAKESCKIRIAGMKSGKLEQPFSFF